MKDILKENEIIVFDGVCLLCNKYVEFVAKNDYKNHFKFVSMQNKSILNKFSNDQNIKLSNKSIIVINNQNKLMTKSSAVIYILSKLKFPYTLISVFNIFPKILLDLFYDIIANIRYKLFGKIDHCSIIESSKIKGLNDKIIK